MTNLIGPLSKTLQTGVGNRKEFSLGSTDGTVVVPVNSGGDRK